MVHDGQAACLIDAGFSPRTIAHRMAQIGLSIEDLQAVCVTHLDQDHFRPAWAGVMLAHRIPLFLHRWHVYHLRNYPAGRALETADLLRVFDEQPFELPHGLAVSPVLLPHDHKGTCGFLLEAHDTRIGYATDLGRVPDQLIERFAAVHILAIESNYDPQLQLTSARPHFLKARIMGGKGHLSNREAFLAAQRIAQRSPEGLPRHIVLLHRSAQCNSRRRIEEAYLEDPALFRRVTLTHQRRRTPWLTAHPPAHPQHQLPFER